MKREFFLSCHSIQYDRVFPVNVKVTVLFVRRDSGMFPVTTMGRLAMLFSSDEYFACRLPNVLFPTWTVKTVHTFLLSWVLFGSTFCTENVSHFVAALENHIKAGFFCYSSQRVRNIRNIGKAHKWTFFNTNHFLFCKWCRFLT